MSGLKSTVFILVGLLLISLASAPVEAKQSGKDKNKQSKQQKVDKKHKAKKLPPGLQKKVNRGGQLPPGWQKKLIKGERLEEQVYQHAVRVDLSEHSHSIARVEGTIVVKIDDRLIRLYEATREIVDILK